ncbi:hypothetical protein RJ55_07889 [Drechmeria coniospora]|nr:hypothetical protein RJ55_07889 [Drechmeria coniospora]
MASLNLSTNGPSIKSTYNGVVNGPPLSSSSPTYAQWALFSVQAPLVSAFQDGNSKESVLKVESSGDGELVDLVEDFNEGRIQFAFVKVKDPNTGLPKCVLVAWCGGGVPERTKGYFTSHTAAVAKVLHGYHVQITARSDGDLEPASIMKKVADASGAKYSTGSAGGIVPSAPPPVKSKPVFTPTASSSGRSVNPLVAARSRRDENVDADGWGADAPPVSRTELQKVESAYKPTKVNMAELTKQTQEPSRYVGGGRKDSEPMDVVKGAYQPVGKVDIAAIRAAAKNKTDDRPTPVKGTYEPVGKVDIAAIRAMSQKPSSKSADEEPPPMPVTDRASVFSQPSQSERITSLPRPKVGNKFGGASGFAGTKAPTPGSLGFGGPIPAPVTSTSRTFADQGGKTPAQIWAEKKGLEKGAGGGAGAYAPGSISPVSPHNDRGGEWKSGYTGKSWAPVQAAGYQRGNEEGVPQQNNGDDDERSPEDEPAPSAGGVSALRDRFKNAAPIGSAPAPPLPNSMEGHPEASERSPPLPPPSSTRPSGAFALPGLPMRPPPPDEHEEPDEEEDAHPDQREPSPIQVAAPVSRGADPKWEVPEAHSATPPVPTAQAAVPDDEAFADDHRAPQRGIGTAAELEPGQGHDGLDHLASGGKRAVIQYDYEKAEDNEIELVEGEYVTNIDMVDEDWWMGTNAKGESGLFPSNYVELVEDDPQSASAPSPPPPPAAAEPPAAADDLTDTAEAAHGGDGATATALYDYEAAEDNELSFPEDATITGLEFPDEDWWFGQYDGRSGLFPANYVQLDS